MMNKKVILLIIGIAIVAILTTACGNNINRHKYSEEEKEYYQKLESFKSNDREVMERYIDTYVKYCWLDIPESDLQFIRDTTEKLYFESKVLKSFSNTIDATQSEDINTDIEAGFIPELSEMIGEGSIEENIINMENNEELISNSSISSIIYIFKTNTYIAKIVTPSGDMYNICFKVENGKVVDIYEM